MAVELTDTSKTFVGTGVLSNYSPNFYANTASQVKVYVNGVLKILGDDYTLTGLRNAAGVTVSGNFPLNATVLIDRQTEITQLVDTQNHETILEDVLDDEFDKLTMIDQEQQNELLRAILVPKGEAGITLPAKSQRLLKLLATSSDGSIVLLDQGSIGKGDPGGNAMAVGVFTSVNTLTIPVGTDLIQTTGYANRGDGGLARYVYDPAIDAAYVAAHPRASVLTANGRGFRLAEQVLDPKMFGSAGGSGWLAGASWAAFIGLEMPFLAPVKKSLRVPASWAMPVTFNDQLGGSRVIFDGEVWRFEYSRYGAIDFTRWLTATHYYVDYTKSDANDGLSAANAYKTFDKFCTTVAAAPAGSAFILHCKEDQIGWLSGFNLSQSGLSGRHVKIIGEGPSGVTRFLNMREDVTQASLAFVAHGANGAWKTNSASVRNVVSGFYLNDRDELGIPRPIVSTGTSALSVETTPLSSFDDGTWFYINLPNGVKPNPFVNWLYSNNVGARQFNTDTGTILFENVDVFASVKGASFNCMRFRSTTDAAINSSARIGFKNCRFYGASANALGTFDIQLVVTEKCYAAYCFNDLFNIHSFNLNAAKGQAITYYEDRCLGHSGGYTGFAFGLVASGSDNGSTVHDGASVVRVGSRYWNIKDDAIADVGGTDSVNFGVRVCRNGSGAGSYYPSAFIYEAYTGEGLRRRMVLIGCGADNDNTTVSIQVTGSAVDATVLVDRWEGEAGAKVRADTAGQTIKAYNDNSVLYAAA